MQALIKRKEQLTTEHHYNLSLLEAEIYKEKRKYSDSVDRELLFQIRKICDVTTVSFSQDSKASILFKLGDYWFSLLNCYRRCAQFLALRVDDDYDLPLLEIISKRDYNGGDKDDVKILEVKRYDLHNKRSYNEEEIKKADEVIEIHGKDLEKICWKQLELNDYAIARLKEYSNYPIQQMRDNILLILSKWKNSDLSIIREKAIITKICKYAWIFNKAANT